MNQSARILLVLLLLISFTYADISISGDARVRPRWDMNDAGDYGNKTTDIYYFYWARLDIKADIGDGYFFKTRLAHNGAGNFIGKFGTGDLPSSVSYKNAGRGTVDFLLAYFGYQGKTYGWSTGLLPVPGSLLIDAHFYPIKPLDIPWILFNNNAAHGFNFNYRFLGQKLDLTVFVDDNSGMSVEGEVVTSTDTSYAWLIDQTTDTLRIYRDTTYTSTTTDPNQSTRDQYTLNLSYPIKALGVQIKPEIFVTLADSGKAAPMTFGADVTLPKVAGFVISAGAGAVTQNVETAVFPGAYSGVVNRFKLAGKVGPGSLVTWVDMFKIDPKLDGAPNITSTSIWLSYKYLLYKSDAGEVSLKPTYRQLTQKIDGLQDLNRVFLELTTEIKF
ncbi:MAG: hypothetical protein K9N38_11685 [Candidatus Marinimicrobia bacterium]|nr:hypothetical protein [Candidatus Neomarinimicrobiota bacterium]